LDATIGCSIEKAARWRLDKALVVMIPFGFPLRETLMLLRNLVVAFGLTLAALSFAVLGLAVMYEDSPECVPGSTVRLLTGCKAP
jgi:hypothetical protein